MSSIQQKPSGINTQVAQPNADDAHGAKGANGAQDAHGAKGAKSANGPHASDTVGKAGADKAAAKDGFSKGAGHAGDVTRSAPPVSAEARPADYNSNLQGAKQNMSAYSHGTSVSPAEAQLLAAENSAKGRKAEKNSDEAVKRQEKTERQAQSIVDSAGANHKAGCHTVHDNHKQNVGKMKELGFTKPQAEAIMRTLEDKRTSPDVKNKLAYQLAAIGMTGKNEKGVSAAIAGNADGLQKQLAAFGDKLEKKLSSGPLAFLSGSGGSADPFKSMKAMHDVGTDVNKMTAVDTTAASTKAGEPSNKKLADMVSPHLGDKDASKVGPEHQAAARSPHSLATQNEATIQSSALSAALNNLKPA